MEKKKRKLLIYACVFFALAAFAVSPIFPYALSLSVMSVYSPICAKDSLMEEENIKIKIQSGKDWFPLVMTYTADGAFSSYLNIPDSKLTILYNFPAFDLTRGCSRLFDESSPYYNSFYGAYLIQRGDGLPYGFSSETQELDNDAVSLVAGFDFFSLVLDDFGLTQDKRVFNYSLTSKENDVPFAGSEHWTCICSNITVNGVNHERSDFVNSYLQYGLPKFPVSSDFAPVAMKSIVYAKCFPEKNVSVFFYVMSPSEKVCSECIYNVLSKSTLTEAS
ncbi:MAG: hypothetical protein KBI01_04495 [Oscillospiraceae bacterium]|nr:hypothetical protein [Oscillospiraceae bacterium]